MSYSTALKELEKIVERLQSDNIEIDDLSENVKRAKELIEFCRTQLRKTEMETKEL